MIWLSGCVMPEIAGLREDLGYMLTPNMGQMPPAGTWFGVDTGCYTRPYDDIAYFTFLGRLLPHLGRCLFATAPDVVGDAVATLAASAPVLPRIRALGYRAALVGQDGLEALDVPWHSVDCLFIGGSTEWKLSEAAYGLASEARERGKWVHMGRVNGMRRLRNAQIAGFHSADGTKLVRGPNKNLRLVLAWLDQMQRQTAMRLGSGIAA